MKTLDLTHLYQNNVIYRSLIDNKLVFPSNIQEIHHRTRDKEISVLQDSETKVIFLSEIPIVKSLREAGDAGRPVILQKDSEIAKTFVNLSSLIIDKVNQRNKDLEPTTSVKITHTKGCSK